jgi:two-component system sensor histidine kinase UhpB
VHDELGQTLTGVVLQLEGLSRAAPRELREPIAQVQEAAREGMEEVREIARGLRPAVLDEFGLRSALITLTAGFAERSDVHVRHRLAADLPEPAPEQELAIYRVAQESLTNVGRHANAADVLLERNARDGRGFDEPASSESGGVAGMRERALLIGARLTVGRREPSGTEVVLEVPVGARS